MRGRVENKVMTFLIEKIISTELLIDRTAALFIEETCIRVVSNEGKWRVGASRLEERIYCTKKCCLDIKTCLNEISGIGLS